MGSASQLATRGVQLALPDERAEVARNVTVQEEPPKGCPRHRRCPSACKKTCAFPRWAEGTWPCRGTMKENTFALSTGKSIQTTGMRG